MLQKRFSHVVSMSLLSYLLILSNPSRAINNAEEEQNIPMEDVQRFSNAIAQIKQY